MALSLGKSPSQDSCILIIEKRSNFGSQFDPQTITWLFLEQEKKQWTNKISSTLRPWLKISRLSNVNVIYWDFFLLKVWLTEWLLRNFFNLLISVLVGPESHLIPFFPKKKFCLLHRSQGFLGFFFFHSKSHSELLIYRLSFSFSFAASSLQGSDVYYHWADWFRTKKV